METRLQAELNNVLTVFPQYWEDGKLLKYKVIDDLRNYQTDLLAALLANETIKDTYSITVGGSVVFKVEALISMLRYRSYWDNSYTAYSNEIGLTSEGKYLKYNSDIVLDFPHKDCVLEGGMTKEDVGKDEVYYHSILAKEEIDLMLAPKVLTNMRRYSAGKVEQALEFDDHDNLILKGNNLIALHTLKNRYAGKVKCIYIDPPYYFRKQKQSDAFTYNSNFKLSTWLTFMKNRLEIARELLADDGTIFVSISNDGQAHLKLLMDDIFGKENYIETFIWKNTDNADSLGTKSRVSVEFIHAYEKVFQPQKKWRGKASENDDAPLLNASNSVGTLTFPAGSIRFNIPDGTYSAGTYPSVEALTDIEVVNGVNANEVTLQGRFKWGQDYLNEELNKGTYFLIKSNKFSIRYQKPEASIVAPEKFIDDVYLSKTIGVGTNEDSQSHLKRLGIDFSYSKPESLIAFLLRAVTNEGDLVLDFFMGSATTQAVAMKMNRRFIGIEQMDYIETASIPRLEQVIAGEQGGVSQEFNWQGGGSFVYAELCSLNATFVARILAAKTDEELATVLADMIRSAYFNYQVQLERLSQQDAGFMALSLEEKKQILIESLDANLLYVSYDDIDDEQYMIPKSVKAFNHSFYRQSASGGAKQ